uniref:Uncharacterized protein n=1 Tax=uncultured marine virus TaxID=186617 RepID=A0A0F7L847_9VIRU|nr:hypothetical protein [uncultured marine virus]
MMNHPLSHWRMARAQRRSRMMRVSNSLTPARLRAVVPLRARLVEKLLRTLVAAASMLLIFVLSSAGCLLSPPVRYLYITQN